MIAIEADRSSEHIAADMDKAKVADETASK